MTIDAQLLTRSAVDIVGLLRSEQISPLDLLDTLQWQVERVEPHVNALPVRCWERAYDHARTLMQKPLAARGLLCGMPLPIKDLTAVAGVRTTFGSRVYQNHVPQSSDVLVTRLEAQGAIVYAKSNTPEFGAGGHTYNAVYGATRNPWHLQRSAGGSSGGAAAALASGTAWLAHGSDLAGSLRTPAAFCGVVGVRPTPGRIGSGPSTAAFDTLAVEGPMARNVADAALLLDAMCGISSHEPLSLGAGGERFLDAALRPQRPLRIAYSPDLGVGKVDPEITRVMQQAVARLRSQGLAVEEIELDLSAAREAFYALRGLGYAGNYAALLGEQRTLLNPNVVWNIEYGLKLDAQQIKDGMRMRSVLYQQVIRQLGDYDLLICPASIVPPFPTEWTHVRQAAGVDFDIYIDWLAITYALTMLALPVVAMPCGMTAEGLPVGMQLVGKPRGEAGLLAMARALEAALGEWATARPQLQSLLEGETAGHA
ncbi:amidase [Vogesella sp. LIG4]|uniref:amidase n=1 Tax=Vogesella sp. LIG4 TaxID=1192162 RepID=UPI00081F926B|nr:amidase family protein [Vogesella sp. LIG4]SCK24384.1 amidase [Vogesella sp. LIG4]